MFTGIIEEIGSIRSVAAGTHSAVLSVRAERILEDIHTGDSIAVNGVCLTVSSFDRESFTADVMHETLNRSGLGALKKDSPVNLERAMRADGRFGGHIVSGHIDGTGTIIRVRTDDNAVWYTIRAASPVMRYIVEKGSVAIDGISLTVAGVDAESFSVSVIPHPAKQTTLGLRRPGAAVNLQHDCVGKSVEKLLGLSGQTGTAAGKRAGGLTRAFLAENGF